MKSQKVLRFSLASVILLLVLLGVYSAGKLVLTEYTSGKGCPHLGIVPACLIALIAYLCMLPASVLALMAHSIRQVWTLFFLGLAIAGILAGLGAAMEITVGGTCPVGRLGIPMCFVSLGMCVVIGTLTMRVKKIVI